MVDWIAMVGGASSLLINAVLLFSPLITKKATKRLCLKPNGQHSALTRFLADEERFQKFIWKTVGITNLSEVVASCQISANTEQPSKVVAQPIWAANALLLFFKPMNIIGRALAHVGTIFWLAGERNDIENSNHPGFRRELKTRESSPGKTLRFILQDLKETFSLKQWGEIAKNGHHKQDLETPQAYQTSIGAQFSLLTFIGSILGSIWSKKSRKMKLINTLSIISGSLAYVFYSLPIFIRGWQNRRSADGFMTILGMPITILGRGFISSREHANLSGLAGVGGPLIMEGKRRNSIKYQEFVKILKKLHLQAESQPNMTSADFLRQLRNPTYRAAIQKEVGQPRLLYLQNLLQQKPYAPLKDILDPLTLSYQE